MQTLTPTRDLRWSLKGHGLSYAFNPFAPLQFIGAACEHFTEQSMFIHQPSNQILTLVQHTSGTEDLETTLMKSVTSSSPPPISLPPPLRLYPRFLRHYLLTPV